jgi:hypothetical protein
MRRIEMEVNDQTNDRVTVPDQLQKRAAWAALVRRAGLPADFDERSFRERWTLLIGIFDAIEYSGLYGHFADTEWWPALLEINGKLVAIADEAGFIGSNPTDGETAAALRAGELYLHRRLM